MTARLYQQRFVAHLKCGKGNSLYQYEILHEAKVIGIKSVRVNLREKAEEATYFLGDREFNTAKDFIAAYEASRSEAA